MNTYAGNATGQTEIEPLLYPCSAIYQSIKQIDPSLSLLAINIKIVLDVVNDIESNSIRLIWNNNVLDTTLYCAQILNLLIFKSKRNDL